VRRLREARQIRGMSQVALGQSVHISFQQVQKYESGMNRLSVSTLIGFCKALDVSPMDILGSFFQSRHNGESTIDLMRRLSDAESRLDAVRVLVNGNRTLLT
jgi:transcriptional regulator with XRE-family HTH domain